MGRIRTHIRAMMPAAHAFRVSRRPHRQPYPFAPRFGRRDGARGRCRNLVHRRFGGDQQEPQLGTQGIEAVELGRHAVHIDLGIQRGADLLRLPQLLQFPRYIALQLEERRPVDIVRGPFRQYLPLRQEHRVALRTGQMAPDLLGRKGEHRASQRTIACAM